MIDWQSVLFNSLWMVGLAVLLAAFGYAYWAASYLKRPLRVQLGSPGFLRAFWLSMVFFCVGLAGTSVRLWETILWGLLALFSVFSLAKLGRQAVKEE